MNTMKLDLVVGDGLSNGVISFLLLSFGKAILLLHNTKFPPSITKFCLLDFRPFLDTLLGNINGTVFDIYQHYWLAVQLEKSLVDIINNDLKFYIIEFDVNFQIPVL